MLTQMLARTREEIVPVSLEKATVVVKKGGKKKRFFQLLTELRRKSEQ